MVARLEPLDTVAPLDTVGSRVSAATLDSPASPATPATLDSPVTADSLEPVERPVTQATLERAAFQATPASLDTLDLAVKIQVWGSQRGYPVMEVNHGTNSCATGLGI